MSEEKHARYLVDPDTGHVELVVADQVEEKRSVGWVDPQGLRANGYVYNRPEDQLNTDAAGAAKEDRDAYKAKKAKADADAEDAAKKDAEQAKEADEAKAYEAEHASPKAFSDAER